MKCLLWASMGYTAMAYCNNENEAREMIFPRQIPPMFKEYVRDNPPDEVRTVPFALIAVGGIR